MTRFRSPMPATRWAVCEYAAGEMLLLGDGEVLTGLYFTQGRHAVAPDPSWRRDQDAFREARTQLAAYFDGALQEFSLALAPTGTAFQLAVWDALCDISYGQTETYGGLAARLGRPGAARAVGRANRQNPLSVVVPCHRVIGQDGTLTGYGGGLSVKRRLLDLEAQGASAAIRPTR